METLNQVLGVAFQKIAPQYKFRTGTTAVRLRSRICEEGGGEDEGTEFRTSFDLDC